MRYILLILASSCSLFAAQVVAPQISRPYPQAGQYGQAQPYRQWQQPYGGQVQPYGQFQQYGQPQPYVQPYYNPYYTPYEPENGPMRGPNSVEGHQYRP